MQSFNFDLSSSLNLLFQFELDKLSDYLQRTEAFLEDEKVKFGDWMDAQAKRMSTEDAEQFYEWHSDDWAAVYEDFPRTLRYSLIVALYSNLEQFVRRVADAARHRSGELLEPNDLAGSAILFKHQTYLKKVIKINFPDQTPAWQHIVAMNKIRNAIVHEQGLIRATKKDLAAIVAADADLSEESGQIVLSLNYLARTITHLKTFGDELAARCSAHGKPDGLSPEVEVIPSSVRSAPSEPAARRIGNLLRTAWQWVFSAGPRHSRRLRRPVDLEP